ncbi:MAG: hypothetical protein ACOYM0_04790 [Bacteroidales bacterium]
MDKNIVIRELHILLEAINEQFEIIREYEGFIPQIEFDMIMENVRKLYETFHRLQRINDPLLFVEKKMSGIPHPASRIPHPASPISHPASPISHPASRILHPEPRIPDPASRILHPASSIPDPAPPIPDPASPISHPASRILHPEPRIPDPEVDTPILMKPVVKKETQQKRQEKAAELELFASEEPVFNIKLKEAREKSLGPKVSRHESLKAAIGINDKFMFINELFDGNLREYNESIETLGGFTTLPQAQEYLDLLRRKFNWNSASNAFQRIKDLIEKRF